MSQKIKSYDGTVVREPRPAEFVDAAPRQGQRTGRWYPPGGADTFAPPEAIPHLIPVMVHRRRPVQRIACEITTAGDANSVVRLGIYSDADGTPRALVCDFGTTKANTVGPKIITAPPDLVLDPGQYWLAVVVQGGASARPTLRATSTPNPAVGMVSNILEPARSGYRIPSAIVADLPPLISFTNVATVAVTPTAHIQF